jgi:Group II intron, maturase-specific domain
LFLELPGGWPPSAVHTRRIHAQDGATGSRSSTSSAIPFRPRLARRRQGRIGVSFSPAVSSKALKAVRRELRTWKLPQRSDKSLDDLARMFNPIIGGWIPALEQLGDAGKEAFGPGAELRVGTAPSACWSWSQAVLCSLWP